MKAIYLITLVLIIAGLIVWIFFYRNAPKNVDSSVKDSSTVKTHTLEKNHYNQLRSMAFNTTSEQLGLALNTNDTMVYGVIMDWEMDGAVVTTVAYATGDASMYLSSGGAVIGGGQHANVNAAARLLVQSAQAYLSKSTKTESKDLPEVNTLYFYLLTNKGIYVGKEEMKNMENSSSNWLHLFEEVNKVITALRLVSEK